MRISWPFRHRQHPILPTFPSDVLPPTFRHCGIFESTRFPSDFLPQSHHFQGCTMENLNRTLIAGPHTLFLCMEFFKRRHMYVLPTPLIIIGLWPFGLRMWKTWALDRSTLSGAAVRLRSGTSCGHFPCSRAGASAMLF